MASWGHTGHCLNENCSRKLPYKVGPDGRGGEPWRVEVDQRTGARGGPEAEPLRTMRETRSGLKCGFRDAWAEEAFFAWNAVGERVGAVVRVGDAVRPRTRTGKFE